LEGFFTRLRKLRDGSKRAKAPPTMQIANNDATVRDLAEGNGEFMGAPVNLEIGWNENCHRLKEKSRHFGV